MSGGVVAVFAPLTGELRGRRHARLFFDPLFDAEADAFALNEKLTDRGLRLRRAMRDTVRATGVGRRIGLR